MSSILKALRWLLDAMKRAEYLKRGIDIDREKKVENGC